MATYVTGRNFTREMCEALGIDWRAHDIQSVAIKADYRDAVVATLEMVVGEATWPVSPA